MKKILLTVIALLLFSCSNEEEHLFENKNLNQENLKINNQVNRKGDIKQHFIAVLNSGLTNQNDIINQLNIIANSYGLTKTPPIEDSNTDRGIDCVRTDFHFGRLYCVLYVCTVSVGGFPLYTNYTLDMHSSNGQVTTASWYDFFD